MAAEFDLQAGLDPSALTSITQAQLLQMIAQMAPLLNKGLVIAQAGTSLNTTISEGDEGSPDVTNNPRYSRYIWLNTYAAASAPPTPYYYDASTGDWTSTAVAAGSIVNASINAAAAIAITKLAAGTARFIVRTNAAGTALEYCNPNSIFTNDDVPLTAIDDTGASGTESFLRRVSGAATWKTFAETVTAIQNALSGVPVTVLQSGSNNTLLGTGTSGVVAMDTPNNLIANGAINLAKLAASGASAGSIPYWSGSSWVAVTPSLQVNSTAEISTTGKTSGSSLAVQRHVIAHGLGAVRPKAVRVVMLMNDVAGDAGYSQGDEVEAYSFLEGSTPPRPGINVCTDTTNITINQITTTLQILHKTTSVVTAVTETLWTWKVYAWV